MGKTYTTESDKQSRNSRDRARRILNRQKIEKKCQFCDSLEELEVDHIDDNPLNNNITNLRYLCKVCHMVRHGKGRKEDYCRCENCEKLRQCGNSPLDKKLLCSRCFKNQCKERGLDPFEPLKPIKLDKFDRPIDLNYLWIESHFDQRTQNRFNLK